VSIVSHHEVDHFVQSDIVPVVSSSGTRHRKSEKEEDEELIKHDDDDDDEGVYVYDESPACEYRRIRLGGKERCSQDYDHFHSRQGRQDAGLSGCWAELDGFATS
jgi:hypothetical protein